MRVVLYYPWIYVKSGIERIVAEIKLRSRHDITIATHHYDRDATYPELKTMGIIEVGDVSVSRDLLSVARAAVTIGRTRLETGPRDAIVVCCEGLGSLINFRNDDVPILNICFTPLRPVFDKEYRARVHARAGILKPILIAAEWLWTIVDRAAWRRYSALIVINQTVRERIADAKLWSGEETLVHPGVARDRIRASDRFERFFFLPGRIMWTKNIELAIEAFNIFSASEAGRALGFRLVIAGMVDRKSKAYLDKLRGLASGNPAIEFVLDPSDSQMREFYDSCWASLFTAFNEDHGITPIESMASGKPVLAVNRGGPRSIVVDHGTGRLLDDTPEIFAAAMREFACDEPLVRRLGAAGIERAPLFTWEHFVATIDEEVDRMVARRNAGAAMR